MSLWGVKVQAPNVNLLLQMIIFLLEFLVNNYLYTYNFNLFFKIENFPLYYSSLLFLIPAKPTNFYKELSFLRKMGNLSCTNKFTSLNQSKKPKLKLIQADKRIGPHNKLVLTIIFGALLGDGYAERRTKGNGTRIVFYQEGSHVSYLVWLHKIFSDLGYCSIELPKIQTRLGSKGKVRKIIRFRTWTFSSFNWIYELWYINGVKFVPSNIGEFLTPLALAIWVMDEGGKVNKGLKLSTNSFSYSDCLFLVTVLYDKFKLKATVQSAGAPDQYQLDIWKESMPLLREIILPYVHSSMKYKLSI